MAAIGVFTVELGGTTHQVEVKKIDLVRAERALEKSVARMDGIGDMYALTWAAMRRLKIDGVPDTFEAFLDAEPDVDVEGDGTDDENSGGKGSGPVPAIG